jgi:hypothetical protein
MLPNLCVMLHPLLFCFFSPLVSRFFYPLLPSLCPLFFSCLVYLVCWLFGTLCFTLFSSAFFFFFPSCVPLLLSPSSLAFAHCFFPVWFIWFVGCLAFCVSATLGISFKLSLPVMSAPPISSFPLCCSPSATSLFLCPPRCAFNATLRVGFQPACDRLPPSCHHPHNLLSLFFLWLFFFFFLILPVFACFSIAIFLYVFFCLFFLFGCFFIFVLLFPCTFFLSCFCL